MCLVSAELILAPLGDNSLRFFENTLSEAPTFHTPSYRTPLRPPLALWTVEQD